MNIIQFLRILWARRILVIVAFVASVVGAYVVASLVQPRYEAEARVNVDILKRDPVVGLNTDLRSAGVYFDAQQQMIRDYTVTGPVVDKLGWLTDPGRIRAYQARPATDTRDFRRWLAQQVADNTSTDITASTVLVITFKSPSAVEAQVGAEALRESYMNAALLTKQQDAGKLAAWYNQQSELAKKAADEAEAKKAAYERETGIIMQGSDTDMDSGRLAALANQLAVPNMSQSSAGISGSRMQLAQLDAQIAQKSKELGPNHPEMQSLRAQRASLAQVVTQEEAETRKITSGQSGAQALSRVLAEEKARVIGQSDKVEKLRQLKSEVDLRRDQYKTTSARAAELALQGSLTDPGLTPMGIVLAPSKPAFPNKPLMVGGAAVLGFGFGLGLALLLEMLNRRVRGVEDLNISSELKCIGVVRAPRPKTSLIRRLLGLGPAMPRAAAA
ncbi:MAG: GumC family protein [Caulobacteraceae bacterium]